MIFKRRSDLCLFVSLWCTFTFALCHTGDDFRFDTDDFQVVYTDPPETVITPPSRNLYTKELAQCPSAESKMMMTLLLRSLKWSDVSEKKKEKAIRKMSRFFLVPTKFIKTDDIHTTEMLEMLKHSINKSNNLLNTKETVGRVEFMIGCGDTIFANSKSLAQKLNEYVKSGKLEELSGLPFQWWNIWSKHIKSRVQRTRRQTALEGSGINEEEFGDEDGSEYYDEGDEENLDEDEEDSDIDLPIKPPRSNQRKKQKNRTKKKYSPTLTQIQDEPVSTATNEDMNIDKPTTPSREYEVEDLIKEKSFPDPLSELIEQTTIRTNENVVDGPTPIGSSEIFKLETEVDKTIENANNVLDVPIAPYQPDDKILEEIVDMIPNVATRIPIDIILSSTTKAPFTYQEAQIPEDVEETRLIDVFEDFDKLTTIDLTTTTLNPSIIAQEEEITSSPIDNIHNHENHFENIFDDKMSVFYATKPTTVIEENISTEKMLPSTAFPSTSSHEHEHDTTLNFPITTIQTTAEIITSSSYEPSTTVSSSTTSIPRILDVTIAHVDIMVDKATTSKPTTAGVNQATEDESNYDDEYDDDDHDSPHQPTKSTTVRTWSTSAPPIIADIITQEPRDKSTINDYDETSSISSTTNESTSESLDLALSSSTTESPESLDYDNENVNSRPRVIKRMNKLQATAGKAFSATLEDAIFDDDEDGKDLKLELLDSKGEPLPENSWIRFNAAKKEIYGLPLEKDVSRHEYKLRATDRQGEYEDEIVDVTVQQHKSFRSVNHQIYIQITLEKAYESIVDWEIRLIRGIVDALEDNSMASIIVRDVRPNSREKDKFTFIYTNDTLPKDQCPETELTALMERLTKKSLNDAMRRDIGVRTVEKELVGSCQNINTTPKLPVANNRNFPPTLRNPVDRVTATVGELFIYEVPDDTFYDPEDQNDLKLTLLNKNRTSLNPSHWLQFDSKNREFYGVPNAISSPKVEESYVLVAEDKNGLTANDALIVEVINRHLKQDYSAAFEYQLDMTFEQFQTASMKRKFIERIAQYFNKDTESIIIKYVKKISSLGRISVMVQNTTLHNEDDGCPRDIERKIGKLRSMLLLNDKTVNPGIKNALGTDFNVQKINVAKVGKCAAGDSLHHSEETIPINTAGESEFPLKITEEVLITYVLPAAIILLMLLIALLIACLLYKRRSTGKMELGDEEERKSFRSKGIPVIFQDELDEKPEIVTKSPIILKDEKPPLLPQYNGMNGQDCDDDNLDQYIAPQGPLMGSRESRGKSPVTPSYRKPPPYVSP